MDVLGEKELVVEAGAPIVLASRSPSASRYAQLCRAVSVKGIPVLAPGPAGRAAPDTDS